MRKMKRFAITHAAISVLLLIASGWLLREYRRSRQVIQAFDEANLSLAYSLLADGIAGSELVIFSGANAEPAAYTVGDYHIRVFPLPMGVDHESWGLVNFLTHNHQAVFMYACRMWASDRELAVALLTLLAAIHPGAQDILDDYQEHGRLTTTRGMVEMPESMWRWFAERFMYQRKTPSNNVIHAIGSNAPQHDD